MSSSNHINHIHDTVANTKSMLGTITALAECEKNMMLLEYSLKDAAKDAQIEQLKETVAFLQRQIEAGAGPSKRARKAPAAAAEVEDPRAAAARRAYQSADPGQPAAVGEPERRRKIVKSTEEALSHFRDWFKSQKLVPSKGSFLSLSQVKYKYSLAFPDRGELSNIETSQQIKLCLSSDVKHGNVQRKKDKHGVAYSGWCIYDLIIANDEETEEPEQSLPMPQPGGLAGPTE